MRASARKAAGVHPVHRLNARWKALISENPTRNATSATDMRSSRDGARRCRGAADRGAACTSSLSGQGAVERPNADLEARRQAVSRHVFRLQFLGQGRAGTVGERRRPWPAEPVCRVSIEKRQQRRISATTGQVRSAAGSTRAFSPVANRSGAPKKRSCWRESRGSRCANRTSAGLHVVPVATRPARTHAQGATRPSGGVPPCHRTGDATERPNRLTVSSRTCEVSWIRR